MSTVTSAFAAVAENKIANAIVINRCVIRLVHADFDGDNVAML